MFKLKLLDFKKSSNGFSGLCWIYKNMFKLKLLDFKNSSNGMYFEPQIATAFLPLCPLKTLDEITIK